MASTASSASSTSRCVKPSTRSASASTRSPRREKPVERRDRLSVKRRVVGQVGASRDGPPPGDLEVQPRVRFVDALACARVAPSSAAASRHGAPAAPFRSRTWAIFTAASLSVAGRAGSIVRRSGHVPAADEIDRRTRRASAASRTDSSRSTGWTTSSSAGPCSNPDGAGRSTSKPIAGTASCQYHHLGVCVRGRLGVRTDDGATMEVGPGMVFDIPPGHDGWVIGDEPWETYDFAGMRAFGRTIDPDDRILASILFTDVVDSTATAERMGDARWRETISTLNELCQSEVDRLRGRIVKKTGDGILALFDSSERAVRAAAACVDRHPGSDSRCVPESTRARSNCPRATSAGWPSMSHRGSWASRAAARSTSRARRTS